jgi:hypothetical protein
MMRSHEPRESVLLKPELVEVEALGVVMYYQRAKLLV